MIPFSASGTVVVPPERGRMLSADEVRTRLSLCAENEYDLEGAATGRVITLHSRMSARNLVRRDWVLLVGSRFCVEDGPHGTSIRYNGTPHARLVAGALVLLTLFASLGPGGLNLDVMQEAAPVLVVGYLVYVLLALLATREFIARALRHEGRGPERSVWDPL